MVSEGKLQQARTKLLEAQHETSAKAQITLYKEASQLYLQAANEIQDVLGKQTMVYLAHSALSEGLRIKSFLTASHSAQRPKSLPLTQPTNATKADDNVFEHCRRIIMNVHLERIKGLQKIPKEVETTPKEILKDLMHLEAQINNLGFKRTPAQMQKSMMASRHASALGESFMILDEGKTASSGGAKASSAGGRRAHEGIATTAPPAKIASAKPPVDAKHSNASPPHSVPPPPSEQPQMLSLNTLLQILPYIPGFGLSTNGQVVPDKQQEGAALSNVMESIEWNDKSMFLSPQKRPLGKKPEAGSTSSPPDISNLDEAAVNESIIQVVATLRDENVKLDSENKRIVQEMKRFQEEYKKKFKELRTLVGDPLLSSVQDSSAASDPPESSNAPMKATKQLDKNESPSEKEERLLERQIQLESIIQGLLDKYYSAQGEIQRRDKQLEKISTSVKQLKQQQGGLDTAELEKLVAQAMAAPPLKKKSDDLSGSGSSSDKLSRSASSGLPSDLSSSTSAQSNSVMYSAQARKQLLQSQLQKPTNRHPSTYTLESLQRTNPTKPPSK